MESPVFPPARPFAPPPSRAPEPLAELAASRDRLVAACQRGLPARVVTDALEEAPVVLAAALRLANSDDDCARTVGSAEQAVRALGFDELARLARGVHAADPLGAPTGAPALRFRAHALAVRALAVRIAAEVGVEDVGELSAAALLHDIGKAALRAGIKPDQDTPERRRALERAVAGVDHAERGGQLARRWRLPARLAGAIESHHDDRLGMPAVVRLADMLVHARDGHPVDPDRLLTAGLVVGIGRSTLEVLLHEPLAPRPPSGPAEAPPLSPRELEVLRGVGAGRSPKQVAADLVLAEATVRSHLRRIYRRLGVSDRTQAVLAARERGWLT